MARALCSPRPGLLPPWRPERGDQEFSGGSRHQPSRSEVPSPGRWTGQTATHPVAYDHATVDWSAYPLRTPSGGGLRADPGQKRVPGEKDNAKGIDQSRPVTEGIDQSRPVTE